MTTKYVKKTGFDSGTTGPFKTIEYGINQLSSGDILVVSDGVYKEQITITKSNITIRSETPLGAIIDGGWENTNVFPNYTTSTWGLRFRGQIIVAGNNITFEGFKIRNCKGRGLTTTGDSWIVRNIYVEDVFNTGIQSYKNDDGVFEGCTVSRVSLQRKWKFQTINGIKVGKHPNVFPLVQSKNSIIRNCIAVDSGGEGIDVFRCGGGCIIENNISGNNSALQYYVNVTGDGLIHRNNIAFLSKPLNQLVGSPNNAGGFEWRDEAESYEVGFPRSKNVQFYNNLSVNCSEGLWIAKSAGLENAIIANNTIIQGPYSNNVLRVEGRQSGTSWANSEICNNIFYGDDLRINSSNVNEILWSNNAWKINPPNGVSSPFDVIGDPKFVNLVTLPNGAPIPENYKLKSGSICIDAGKVI